MKEILINSGDLKLVLHTGNEFLSSLLQLARQSSLQCTPN